MFTEIGGARYFFSVINKTKVWSDRNLKINVTFVIYELM